ncbi:hypothetical protein LCGC14_0245940 [marine sediment metagenome]|uniref:Uncharacterized protein n=1 Tax=marine sediment metagenome TaxID=412755 RepID=A0A0F9XAK6_9ZZZZ
MFTAQDRFVISIEAVARQKARKLEATPQERGIETITRDRVRMVIGCIKATINTDLQIIG